MTATLEALDDDEAEGDETVSLTASHGGSEIGSVTVTIAPSDAPSPLTAEFLHLPKTHNGGTAFLLELRFSDEIATGHDTLRDTAFEVTGGSVTQARQLELESNLRWQITVQPASDADVVLTLPVPWTCATAGAICTAGGSKLAEAVTATVEGPGAAPAGFPLAPESSRPSGLWSDGETAWVADLDDARLYAYRRSDGERQPEKDITTEPAPMGVWSDGETLWVADWRERIYAYRLSDGGREPRKDIGAAGLWAADGTLLSTGWEGREVRAYRMPVTEDTPDARPSASRNAREGSMPRIADPAGATGLKELDLGFNPLADLSRLVSLPALESLNLDGSAVDLGPLAALPGLQRLSVRHNLLDDLQLLAAQAALTELDIGENRIKDLRPLAGLAGLAVLRADRNAIADLWPLASLTGLEVLDLGANQVRDLQPLAELEGLRMLRLDGNRPSGLHPLSGLKGLADLGLAGNAVGNMGPFAGLDGLRRLDLRGSSISDLRPLRALPSLVWVHVGGSRMEDLTPLAGLDKLTEAGRTDLTFGAVAASCLAGNVTVRAGNP